MLSGSIHKKLSVYSANSVDNRGMIRYDYNLRREGGQFYLSLRTKSIIIDVVV